MNSCLPGQVGKESYLPRHTNPPAPAHSRHTGKAIAQRGKTEGGSVTDSLEKQQRKSLLCQSTVDEGFLNYSI